MKKKLESIKMNLSLEKEFYDFLLDQAEADHLRTSTWVKQYLKKHLLKKNKTENMDETNERA